MSLKQLQEIPLKNLVLLVGPPGVGKSEFCEQIILQSSAIDQPIIYLTTDLGPLEAEKSLRERGLKDVEKNMLNFIDAYNETVGISGSDKQDIVNANCNDLSSIDIAISKFNERIDNPGILLVFNSLTSPYLFNGSEILRFMKQTLSKFAAMGNAVMTCIDEGCSKSEDLVTMMSLSNIVIKMELQEEERIFHLIKHPKMNPTITKIPIESKGFKLESTKEYDKNIMKKFMKSMIQKVSIRPETGDYGNPFWPNLAHWSCILWDPKEFPKMTYRLNKEDGMRARELLSYFPWFKRNLIKLIVPKDFSRVKEMKKLLTAWRAPKQERSGILEYIEDLSKTDEHYIRIYENSDCWGFKNIGTTIASHLPPMIAGVAKSFERRERDWNIIETKCIGLGDPYCEFKLIPGKINELKNSLEKDILIVERVHDRLIDRLMGFLLNGEPLVNRPTLGSDVHFHVAGHAMGFPHIAGERYRMAQRMGGAKSGKKVGERLLEEGISEDEAIKRILNFLEYCKVGKISMNETIRIRENIESLRTVLFANIRKEPCCYFTTGFFNGFFYAIKNLHVKETKCIVSGDSYCEWEFI